MGSISDISMKLKFNEDHENLKSAPTFYKNAVTYTEFCRQHKVGT